MTASSKVHTLVLYLSREKDKTLGYFDDWRTAFLEAENFDVTALNIVSDTTTQIIGEHIKEYELIVLLHSTNGDTLDYLRPLTDILNRRHGKLISFVGNEVNLPGCLLSEKIEVLKTINADFIATQLPLSAGEYLYGELRSKVVAVPHALNCNRFKPIKEQFERKIDIGVRAHKYKGILGDDERNRITDFFKQKKLNQSLIVDIETDMFRRFTPDEWMLFLNNCKGTISTEAGSYYLERDDVTVKRYLLWVSSRQNFMKKSYEVTRNWYKKIVPNKIKNLLSRKVIHMNPGVIQKTISDMRTEDCSFEEIFDLFFREYENPVSGKCISSRHFEAIGTKTIQIMFPGLFNGILVEDVHYLGLKKDFSNCDEVLRKFNDMEFRKSMVDETYAYTMDQHLFSHRIEYIYRIISK